MNLFEKTTMHSLLAVFTSFAVAPFIVAHTNTCLRGISGYSGMPGHIEIRWANDRNHRIAFCRYPLQHLIGSYCASRAIYVTHTWNARYNICVRYICTCAYTRLICIQIYTSTRVYQTSRHERETPAHGRFREATLFMPTNSLLFTCMSSFISLHRSQISLSAIKRYKMLYILSYDINNYHTK